MYVLLEGGRPDFMELSLVEGSYYKAIQCKLRHLKIRGYLRYYKGKTAGHPIPSDDFDLSVTQKSRRSMRDHGKVRSSG